MTEKNTKKRVVAHRLVAVSRKTPVSRNRRNLLDAEELPIYVSLSQRRIRWDAAHQARMRWYVCRCSHTYVSTIRESWLSGRAVYTKSGPQFVSAPSMNLIFIYLFATP